MTESTEDKIKKMEEQFNKYKEMDECPVGVDIEQKLDDYLMLRLGLIYDEAKQEKKPNKEVWCYEEMQGFLYWNFEMDAEIDCMHDHDTDCDSEDCTPDHQKQINDAKNENMFSSLKQLLEAFEDGKHRIKTELEKGKRKKSKAF